MLVNAVWSLKPHRMCYLHFSNWVHNSRPIATWQITTMRFGDTLWLTCVFYQTGGQPGGSSQTGGQPEGSSQTGGQPGGSLQTGGQPGGSSQNGGQPGGYRQPRGPSQTALQICAGKLQ